MSRFASDPDLTASHTSSGTLSLDRSEHTRKTSSRGIQRLVGDIFLIVINCL